LEKVYPEKPFYLFTFQDRSLFIEYRKYWVINEIFSINSVGIVTGQDVEAIAFSLMMLNNFQ